MFHCSNGLAEFLSISSNSVIKRLPRLDFLLLAFPTKTHENSCYERKFCQFVDEYLILFRPRHFEIKA